ncbi:MAG TPA: Clp protease N-terminal domain-containing protein [Acidimicrobiales bacterium]|nr:Clp protease N-terminal domain-containing protein [Acidimicrobiales bacterium]
MLDPVFERFNDDARRVLVLAQEEARLLDHNFIGTEHILLGLVHQGQGVAARALGSLGITLQEVREKVEQTVGRGHGRSPAEGSPPFTPRAKRVLELSLREALALGHKGIGSEHILLGLVREGQGVAAQVLVGLGADLSRVRQQVAQLVPEDQPKGGPAGEATASSMPNGPLCSWCRSSLAESARYQAIDVPSDAKPALPVRVVLVYCSRCGTVLSRAGAGRRAGGDL